jgi:2-iminobutanoate/2-iminopropanoate deaminase
MIGEMDGGGKTVRTRIQTDAAPAAIGPYSQAIAAAGLVFTAGQVGAEPSTGVLADGITAQTERAMANLASVLAAAGTGFDHVLKTIIFLVDMGDFAAVNAAYERHLSPPYPARSTVAVAALPKGGLVEIEMVALAGDTEPGQS